MCSTLRGITLALFAALMLVVLISASVQAESWSSPVTSGLTSVESVFLNGTYTWTLTNNSSLPGDSNSAYDILVWSLMPFQVNESQSVSTPAGWEWKGDSWAVAANNKQYYTPPSLGPGRSLVFQYTPLPSGHLINSSGPQPTQLGFVLHVAAVMPDSGSLDGKVKWLPTTTQYGPTWHDRAIPTPPETTVPELKGLFVLGFGVISMGLTGARRRLQQV